MYVACIFAVLAAFAAVEAQKTGTRPTEKPTPAVDCSRIQCAFPDCQQGYYATVVSGNCCPTCELCLPRPCPRLSCPNTEVPEEDPCACPQCVSDDTTLPPQKPVTSQTDLPTTTTDRPETSATSPSTRPTHPTRPTRPTETSETSATPPTRPDSSDSEATSHPTRPPHITHPNKPTIGTHPTHSKPTFGPTIPSRPNSPTKPVPPNPVEIDVVEEGRECVIPGQKFMECGSACPPVCGKEQPGFCTLQCVAECQCPEDTFLDTDRGECVAECIATRTDPVSSKPDCFSEPDGGPCEANLRRYYYNLATGQCEVFSYSGCGGNGNNFKTIRECQKRCLF